MRGEMRAQMKCRVGSLPRGARIQETERVQRVYQHVPRNFDRFDEPSLLAPPPKHLRRSASRAPPNKSPAQLGPRASKGFGMAK